MRTETDADRVVTCDPGVDDAVALAVAAGRPDCRLRAVVAGAGNVDARSAWRNAQGLARLFELDVPVGIGSAMSVDGAPIRRLGGPHGPDGLSGSSGRLPAPPGPPADGRPLLRGEVVALGPLTDVAGALRARRPIARVVWMGGATIGPAAPDVSVAEFNASADPAAVDQVLASGVDMAIVPLAVTRQVSLARADLARWAAGPRRARFCADLVASRLEGGRTTLHDPVALVAALEPDLFTWQVRRLRCTRGDEPSRGALVVDTGGTGDARVAVAVDAGAVAHRIVDAVLTATR